MYQQEKSVREKRSKRRVHGRVVLFATETS
jgi:hypothetical protein